MAAFVAVMAAPTPEGLSVEGQRALAVMVLAVGLWATEALPNAVTGIVGIVALVLVDAGTVEAAVYGFSQPVSYFLVGILTLGLAVQQSGLAERMARFLVRLAGGSPGALYVQMLVSFAALTFALPSATTRGAIMVHVYEQVMGHWRIATDHPLNQAVMMAMGSLNRLGSTALLAGGITPVVASSILGGFSWTGWFVMMAVPFYAMLAIGGIAVYLLYRPGFRLEGTAYTASLQAGPVTTAEIKAALVAIGTALLWFTDFAHGLPPTIPALIAMAVILLPGVGLLSWTEFERGLGWSNFFVIATSLSLSNALVSTGAAVWFAEQLVSWVGGLATDPVALLMLLALVALLVRLFMPNIAGYLAFMIPIAVSAGGALGLNPLVCGLAVVVVGDAVVYYPAAGASSVFIYDRANITAPAVFRTALVMAAVSLAVLLVSTFYWSALGEGLTG